MATFGDTEQLAFKTGVATIASTTAADVTITSVAAGTARRRHLLADSVTVAYVVDTGRARRILLAVDTACHVKDGIDILTSRHEGRSVLDDVAGNGPVMYCSPRHRMAFDSSK